MIQAQIEQKLQTENEYGAELIFIGYSLAILVDLTVINLFDEYSDYVTINSFSISLLAAILMQLLLKLTLAGEKALAGYFKKKRGFTPKVLRGITSYIILVGSKFVILEVIDIVFGDRVSFTGPWNGVVVFIVLVTAILASEFLVNRIYHHLKDRSARNQTK